MKILVMGLPGTGKTYLTERLVPIVGAAWFNADKFESLQTIGIFQIKAGFDNLIE